MMLSALLGLEIDAWRKTIAKPASWKALTIK